MVAQNPELFEYEHGKEWRLGKAIPLYNEIDISEMKDQFREFEKNER